MSKTIQLAILVAVLSASTAFAGDGSIPQTTLDKLGLSDLRVLSDSEGADVRGRGGNTFVLGGSMVSTWLIDSYTQSYIFGFDANTATASSENACCHTVNISQENHESATALMLDVTGAGGGYTGFLFGGSGGSSVGQVH